MCAKGHYFCVMNNLLQNDGTVSLESSICILLASMLDVLFFAHACSFH